MKCENESECDKKQSNIMFDGHRDVTESRESQKRGGKNGGKDREAHSELWSGYWKRDT